MPELWKGLPRKRVQEIFREIPYHPGVKETMEALHARASKRSSSQRASALLVDRVSEELGITLAVANELIVEEGNLTGDIRINVQHDDGTLPLPLPQRRGQEARRAAARRASPGGRTGSSDLGERSFKGYWVRRILEDMGVDKEEAAAVGDGEGDLAMFEAVGVAIGYHPSERIVPALDHALHNGSFTDVLDVLKAYL